MKLLVVLSCLFHAVQPSKYCYSSSTFADQHVLISKSEVNNKTECTKLCDNDDTPSDPSMQRIFNMLNGENRSQAEIQSAKRIKVKVNEGCKIFIECSDGIFIFDEAGEVDKNVPSGFTKATASCK
ncbi:hypothetical protein PRIPAC_91635 [Pristionchus pacificus]|uniref:Uncharacterized protein n=1 Tax=Pristionchus pacificus TaxID=54126 RepID=A0A2A6BPJ9_PRIPA|nr:hypothetical protein PRIPAC_91635 [Pristionchus pacificus]|eukprot:PDM67756.1 hypothetical protein PRIPAC_45800 [Pristionchus pacificus]